MSDYNQQTDFSIKDNLPSGDPEKKIVGADIDAELEAIASAISTKKDKTSIFAGFVDTDTDDTTSDGWDVTINDVGDYTITHNFGSFNYSVILIPEHTAAIYGSVNTQASGDHFRVIFRNPLTQAKPDNHVAFSYILIKRG